MNMSLETDRGLWLLAEQAKSSPLLFAILTTSSNPIETLQHSAEGREFLKDLKDFLNIYGHRTATTHDFSEDTWFENPSYALPLIANYVRKDFDWDAEFKQTLAERDAKVKELFDRLPDNEPANRFKTLYQWAFDCWGADEDHHFYIDAMIAAKSRYFLKNVGRTLVRNQVIAREEDIFICILTM